jgi:hypothetical protein
MLLHKWNMAIKGLKSNEGPTYSNPHMMKYDACLNLGGGWTVCGHVVQEQKDHAQAMLFWTVLLVSKPPKTMLPNSLVTMQNEMSS